MTFLIFMLGFSTALTTVTGVIAWMAAEDAKKSRRALVASEAKRLKALEATRRDMMKVLEELQRFTQQRRPEPFLKIVGGALHNHEAISRVAAEIAAR